MVADSQVNKLIYHLSGGKSLINLIAPFSTPSNCDMSHENLTENIITIDNEVKYEIKSTQDQKEGGKYEIKSTQDQTEGGKYESKSTQDQKEGEKYESKSTQDQKEGENFIGSEHFLNEIVYFISKHLTSLSEFLIFPEGR